jgi:hypothetical protein
MTFAISSIRDVTGVNIEMLGLREDDQPGIVEACGPRRGLTILAGVFDAMRLYRKRQGIVLAEFVTEVPVRWPADPHLRARLASSTFPLIRQGDIEYDTVVDESPASRDVKEKTWMSCSMSCPAWCNPRAFRSRPR